MLLATACSRCVRCSIWPPESTRGLRLRPSGADPGGRSWRSWPRRASVHTLVLLGCGLENTPLWGSRVAPWDLGMFLQLILGAQKRITRLGMLVTSPPGSGGGATWHVPSLLGVDGQDRLSCLSFPSVPQFPLFTEPEEAANSPRREVSGAEGLSGEGQAGPGWGPENCPA